MLTNDGISTTSGATYAPRRTTASGTTRVPAAAKLLGVVAARTSAAPCRRTSCKPASTTRLSLMPKRQQHGLLQPLVHDPVAVALAPRRAACRRRGPRCISTASRSSRSTRPATSSRAAFPGAFDDFIEVLMMRSSEMLSRARRSRPSRSALPRRSELASSSGWLRRVRDEEHVLGALADGQDLRVLQRDALLLEDLARPETAGPGRSPATSSIDRALVQRVARDRDLHGRREHAHLPRRAARDLERLLAAARQSLQQAMADLVEPALVDDRAAVALEHAVGVEARRSASGTMRASTIVSPSSSSTAVDAHERAGFLGRVHDDRRQALRRSAR